VILNINQKTLAGGIWNKEQKNSTGATEYKEFNLTPEFLA